MFAQKPATGFGATTTASTGFGGLNTFTPATGKLIWIFVFFYWNWCFWRDYEFIETEYAIFVTIPSDV